MNGTRGTVVIGFDGSTGSVLATAWGSGLAEALSLPVDLVHALSLPPLPVHSWELSVEKLLARHEAEIAAQLDAQVASLIRRGLAARRTIRRFLAAEALIEHAREVADPLLVLGQHGNFASRLLVGSVSSAVVRLAEGPVVVVRGEPHTSPPRRTLVGWDGSDPCRAALGAVARWMPSSEVSVVAVEHGQTRFDRAEIERDAAHIVGGTNRVHVRVEEGAPAPRLVEIAAAESFDLVAAGRRGHSGLSHLLLGSVADRVLHLARCPVLVAH